MGKAISNNIQLLNSIVSLIDTSRNRVAVSVNSELTLLYWNIGKQINERADYGKQILFSLSTQLTELGTEFAFLARQKRIIKEDEDFYIDLLFYHRELKCLIAVDLKLDKYKASYIGKMKLYLRWLEKNEIRECESEPIGLILCSEKLPEQINYLILDTNKQIKVAQYLTKLPQKQLLAEKLSEAIILAKNRLRG
ncbi:MAG: PDDEXK nuclease domain-containing protein [Melioribacteraceae bacterium]|nr:PDDEXK nuclease domain-containing protein [Melioribacteraceae bacterium]